LQDGYRIMVVTLRDKEPAGFFFFSSRRRHTRSLRDWSSDVCSSDLYARDLAPDAERNELGRRGLREPGHHRVAHGAGEIMKEAAAIRVRDQSIRPPGE